MKNVFLIGDSIRQGYCGYVKKNLEGFANVYYPKENCCFTQYTFVRLGQIDGWILDVGCDRKDVDLVHWNNGHWDVNRWGERYRQEGVYEDTHLNAVEDYCKMLERIYMLLKNMFPNAKIIFATTTPMNPDLPMPHRRMTDEIKKYNDAAKKVMERLKVEVNDLFEFMKDTKSDLYKDHCHYTDEGFEILGNRVSKVIKEKLV